MNNDIKFIYNTIDEQKLLYARELTIRHWNFVINSLRKQTNDTTHYLETFHKFMFGDTASLTPFIEDMSMYPSFYAYIYNNLLKKVNTVQTVYGVDLKGLQKNIRYSPAMIPGSIVQRDDNGRIKIGSPVEDNDASNKAYVDTQIQNLIDQAPTDLDTFKEIADNLKTFGHIKNIEGIFTEEQITLLWDTLEEGIYTIISQMYGKELLIISRQLVVDGEVDDFGNPKDARLFKRITGQYDYTYDFEFNAWRVASGGGSGMNEIPGTLSEDDIVNIWHQYEEGKYKEGIYTITSQMYGKELLIISRQLVVDGEVDDFGNPKDDRLFKRMTGGYDYTYDFTLEGWIIASGGTGGTGGTGGIIQLVSISDLEHTIAKGSELYLEFRFNSSIGTKGTLQIYVNDILKKSQAISKGVTPVEVSNLLKVGPNEVIFKVSDTVGNTNSLEYLVDVIELTLQSNFNDLIARTGDFEFRYTPFGSGTKNITFKIDNEPYGTVDVVQSSGVSQPKIIGGLTHGVHTLEVVAEAYVGDVLVPSNKLKYNIMYYVEGETDILISSKFEPKEVTQGELINIEYAFYNPTSYTSIVNKYINEEVYEANLTQENEKLYPFSTTNYPYGTVTFTIDVNGTRKSFEVLVNQFEDNILPIETNLELKLIPGTHSNDEPEETRKHWVFNDIDTELIDFNWATNGWRIDENGIKFLRFNGKAKAMIGLNSNVSKATYLPFDKKFTDTGKVFEFEFVARDVNDVEKPLITCMNGNVGFEISSNKCVFGTGEKTKIITRFKDEEKVRVTFVVQKYNNELGNANLRLVKCLLNGVVSGLVRYEVNDSWIQSNPTDIKINPNDGAIDIYSIRVYNSDYSDKLLLENYITDMNLADKIQAITRNNIIDDSTQSVSYSKIKDLIPILIIQGEMPLIKLGDEVEKPKVKVSYFDPFDSNNNFEYENVEINVQGTSSKDYPRKNYKLKFPIRFPFYKDAVPEKTYTFKADYMESSHSHNTGNAIIMNKLSPKFPTQVDLEGKETGFRNSINGFPIVIFNQPEGSEDLIYYGVFNFNNDKGNSRTLGLDIDLLNELVAEKKLSFDFALKPQSWEFKNNTSNRCQFLSGDFTVGDWAADFEARYHYSDENDYTDLQRVVSWVASTKGNLTKFKNEFSQYFDLDFCKFYYVMMDVILGVDSRAKNMFLDTLDGNIWYPRWYDIDTAYGVNNQGRLVFGYNFEQNDLDENGAPVFNASESVLWNNFGEAYKNEIKIAYLNLRTSGKLSYESLMDVLYGQQISKISEAMYNTDGEFKYIDVFDISKLPQGTNPDDSRIYAEQGTRLNHLQWWLSNRFAFLDSKYFDIDSKDKITMRTNKVVSGDSSIDWDNKFEIMPFTSMYINVKWGSNYKSERGNNNEYTTMDISKDIFSPSGTEVDIYGASRILNIKGFDTKYVEELDVKNATRLVELNVGNGKSGYQNSKLTSLTIGNLTKLEKVDIQNCSNLVSTLDLSGCANIKEVYAKGSAITGILLADGGNLEKLELPKTIANLKLLNQPFLTSFAMDGADKQYENLRTLWIENVPNIDARPIISNARNLEKLRLVGINWTLANFEQELLTYLTSNTIRGMDANGEDTVKPYLNGKIHILGRVAQRQLDIWNEYFQEYGLVITAEKPENSYEVNFVNWDKTHLQTKYVLPGGTVEYTGPTPTKPPTGEYVNVFIGWDKPLTNIQQNTTITAEFRTDKPSYFYLSLDDVDYLKPTFYIHNFKGTAEIDWNDNTPFEEIEINTSYSYNFTHVYEAKGNYNISLLLKGTRYNPTNYCYITLRNTGDGDSDYYNKRLIQCSLQEGIFNQLQKGLLDNSQITTFTIPASIDIVGSTATESSDNFSYSHYNCFYNCANLEEVIFSSENTKIGNSQAGYSACPKLRSVVLKGHELEDSVYIPEDTTRLPRFYIYNCPSISSINLPTTLVHVAYNSLVNLKGITNLSLPDSLEIIDNYSIASIDNLESITIPKNVVTIGSSVFSGCSKLKTIYYDNDLLHWCRMSISNIVNGRTLYITSFTYDSNGDIESQEYYMPTEIVIPNEITSIGNNQFNGWKWVEKVVLHPGVTSIGESAFSSCEILTDINLDDDVLSLGRNAFSSCKELTTIKLPIGLRTIPSGLFSGCNKLTSVTLPRSFESIEGSAFSGTAIENMVLPETVTNIGPNVFTSSKLKSITLPESLLLIGSGAFSHSLLESITIPSQITEIPNSCFRSCTELYNVVLPLNLIKIGYESFMYCSNLLELIVPENVEFIDHHGLYFGASYKTKLVLLPKVPPVIYSNEDYNPSLPPLSYLTELGVTAGYIDVYKSTTEYMAYTEKLTDYGIGFGPAGVQWLLLNSSNTINVPYGNDTDKVPTFNVHSNDTSILTVSNIMIDTENPGYVKFDAVALAKSGSVNVTVKLTIDNIVKQSTFNVDVYNETPSNTYTVSNIFGVTYGFEYDGLYYVSKNRHVGSSFALCRVDIFSYGGQRMYVDCISYGENYQDYGILSKLGCKLASSRGDDTENDYTKGNVMQTFKGLSSSLERSIDYGILGKGSHYLYIKYIKDPSQNQYADTLKFKLRFEKE